MTIDEAIKNREDCLKYLEGRGEGASPDCVEAVRWSVKALKALRPVSREQVEKVFPGCINCHDKERLAKHIHCWPSFCPVCGKPLTDEAVEIMMERLEALHDNCK